MTIFLPKARNGLAVFEASLTPARLEDWLARLHAAEPVRAEVAIPQLKLEARYELGPALSAMGMALAFSDDADLSGISDAERLAVDQVIHQTFLAVDEEGTEAAAATAITIRTVSMPAPPQVRFHADRPFLFLIRDHRTGAIVFIGRITTPRA